MNVLAKKAIDEFARKHADSTDSLVRWYRLTREAEWTQLTDIKETFGHVDFVGNDLYVFNIKGNSYRLIARIFFRPAIAYIRFIGTHAEYDKINLSDL
jgi:mRNA interferase HigB